MLVQLTFLVATPLSEEMSFGNGGALSVTLSNEKWLKVISGNCSFGNKEKHSNVAVCLQCLFCVQK